MILGVGSNKNITAFNCDDGLVVTIGCQNKYRGRGIDDMRIEVAKKYSSDHPYFAALDFIESWHKSTT